MSMNLKPAIRYQLREYLVSSLSFGPSMPFSLA